MLPLSKVGYGMLGDTSLDVWLDKTYLVMWTKYCGQLSAGDWRCAFCILCAVLGIVCRL